jgi:prepilin-type N-terminal cleavage/methylation domain-containing protein
MKRNYAHDNAICSYSINICAGVLYDKNKYPMRRTSVHRAFTLIELLVVIAIIGLLSAVVLASLSQAKIKGADSQREQNLHSFQQAVELYYNDNGHYPNTNGAWTSFDSPSYAPNPIYTPNASNLTTALASYIGKIVDPTSATLGNDSGYLYFSPSGADYCILLYRIPQDMRDFPKTQVPTGRCGAVSNGSCTNSPNSIYVGVGQYSAGC